MNDTWWVAPEQLDEYQREIISLPTEGNHLIIGPPGSGKTNLLLLRAKHLTLTRKHNWVLLVFNRTLQEFVSSGVENYGFDTEKVMTHFQWLIGILKLYGESISLSGTFEENRLQLLERVSQLILDKNVTYLWESILLDEAQDYLPEEIELFKKLGKTIFAVADSRQKIYRGNDPINLLISFTGIPKVLKFHYRNGYEICRFADGIAKVTNDYVPLSITSNYDEANNKSSVKIVPCMNIQQQCEYILGQLESQLKTFPDELLGVICPRHEELMYISKAICESPVGAIAHIYNQEEGIKFNPDKRIYVSTLHSAKGLEFRTLHIAGCEFIAKFPYQRNMAYTAITRAKTSLSIYHSSYLPGYIQSAYDSLQGPVPEPQIKDYFSK